MLNPNIRFGIDLGGTKIEILALDKAGNEVYRKRIATPQGSYQATIKSISGLVLEAESDLNTHGSVGICTPGAISPSSGLLRNSNSTCLNHKPFLQDLQQSLARDIRIANDANCFTLSEAIDGSAQASNIVFGVIIGTGCGGGIVINKMLVDGPNAITGEWGHNPLPYVSASEASLNECWCGRNACIETFLSGSGFERDYFYTTSIQKSSKEIINDADNQHAQALECLQRYEDRMARSLAHVINLLDPHTIVLGGGMSNIERLYQNVPQLWQKYIFSDTVSTQLISPMHE